MQYVLGILFFVLGLIYLIKPSLIWKTTERWKPYPREEDSRLFRLHARIYGIFFLIAGAVVILLPILFPRQ